MAFGRLLWGETVILEGKGCGSPCRGGGGGGQGAVRSGQVGEGVVVVVVVVVPETLWKGAGWDVWVRPGRSCRRRWYALLVPSHKAGGGGRDVLEGGQGGV